MILSLGPRIYSEVQTSPDSSSKAEPLRIPEMLAGGVAFDAQQLSQLLGSGSLSGLEDLENLLKPQASFGFR